MKSNRTMTLSVLLLAAGVATALGQAVTLDSLLDEMVGRDGLARMPVPAYTCRQFSSYDRASTSRNDVATWFANGDSSKFIRAEENDGRTEQVLLDAEGPGAIVRFWATWHQAPHNTMRIYLDGDEKPAVEGPMAEIVDRGVLAHAPLSQGVSPLTPYDRRGHNLYFPIPYAKHCKITYEAPTKGPLYYQINYRTYAPGTRVASFRMDDLKRLHNKVAQVQRTLSVSGPQRPEPSRTGFDGPIAPGRSRSVEIQGPGAIRELNVNLAAVDHEQALRSTILKITFDDEATVWCPVGDFFGVGHRLVPYKTWYTQVTVDGSMACYWTMPFRERCEIALHNVGNQSVNVALGEARSGEWSWDERSMHFHATWRQLTKVQTQTNKGANHGAFDVNYVTVDGPGLYVGDTLTIYNGVSAWWGEGDEKIYVDGEDFPSHFGTGTEDYYGYAWCHPNYFQAPFHAQPCGAGNPHPEMSVNSRYRALDAIPFTKTIKVDMELWHWRKTRMNYAPTTFWYARPGVTCNVSPDPKTAALPVPRRQEDLVEVMRVEGALEGEALRILEKTGGQIELQSWVEPIWSGNRQVWWKGAKPGERLALEVEVEKAGRYRVIAGLTKAKDYGIMKVCLGETVLREALDLYNPDIITQAVELGTAELKAGRAPLRVEVVGANEKAIKSHMFGLDYIKLVAD